VGCSQGDRVAVSVGDETVTRAEFYDYFQVRTEAAEIYDIDRPEAISGRNARILARQLIVQLAEVEAIQEVVGDDTDFLADYREDAAQIIESEVAAEVDRLATGQRIRPLTDEFADFGPDSPGYELAILSNSLQPYIDDHPEVVEQVTVEKFIAHLRTAEIDPRIGIWDASIGEVLTPSGVNEQDRG